MNVAMQVAAPGAKLVREGFQKPLSASLKLKFPLRSNLYSFKQDLLCRWYEPLYLLNYKMKHFWNFKWHKAVHLQEARCSVAIQQEADYL